MITLDVETRACLRVWAAVLVQAAEDAWDKNEVLSRRARRWFVSGDTHAGSFVWICGLFDVDPDRTAAEVLRARLTMPMLRNRVYLQGQRRLAQQRGWYRDELESVSLAVAA